jgi:DNA repair photolyase
MIGGTLSQIAIAAAVTEDRSELLEAIGDRGLPARVTFQDGRAFIPLALHGCGVGCKYCYIGSPKRAAEALSASQMFEMLRTVSDHISGALAGPRPILAIGCDTELAISEAVTANAMLCLDFARDFRLPVQLATKFPLPEPVLQRLECWPNRGPGPIVFTTITTIALSSRLEPNAPTPWQRSANFRPHSEAWQSYALIKPFLETSRADLDALLELLGRERPDGIVVGVRYRRSRMPNMLGDVHPVATKWLAVRPSEASRQFAERLTALGFRVFLNTQCASAWHNASSDGLVVKHKYPHLCVNCGACSAAGS